MNNSAIQTSAIMRNGVMVSSSSSSMIKSFFEHLIDHILPHPRNNYKPHALAHRPLSLYAVFLVLLKLVAILSLDTLPQNQAFSSSITVSNIISLTNASRQSYSLPGLTENTLLDTAAQAKADDMLKNSYFAHVSPDGKTPWYFISAAGYDYIIAGENLAINFYSAEGVEQAWMNSPGHKANILNKDFQDIGIGISQGDYFGVNAIFVVQMFGASMDQPYSPIMSSNNLAAYSSAQSGSQPAGTAEKSALPSEPAQSQPAANVKIVSETVRPVYNGNNQSYQIDVQTQGDAVKVFASMGDQNILMAPTADPNVWTGTFTGPQLASQKIAGPSDLQNKMTVSAYDLSGNSTLAQVAVFSPNIVSTYGFSAKPQKDIQIFGHVIAANSFNNFYLYFVLAILGLLIIAIVVRKDIQHVGMIAHASALVILAIILWL